MWFDKLTIPWTIPSGVEGLRANLFGRQIRKIPLDKVFVFHYNLNERSITMPKMPQV